MPVMLRNTGTSPVKVVTAAGNCACTTSTWPTEPIEPGATAEAVVTLKPSESQRGERLTKKVTFVIEGQGVVDLAVVVQAQLPAAVTTFTAVVPVLRSMTGIDFSWPSGIEPRSIDAGSTTTVTAMACWMTQRTAGRRRMSGRLPRRRAAPNDHAVDVASMKSGIKPRRR